MGFNDNLKGELEYRGMLVKELAHVTGIPKQTIDKYLLSNGSMPPADKAVAIARVLGVSVEYLVTGVKVRNKEDSNRVFSPELRTIADYVEPLSRDSSYLFTEGLAVKATRVPNNGAIARSMKVAGSPWISA